MKKLLILLLTLSMVFAFAACREKQKDPTPSGTNPPTNAPTDAPTDEPVVTPPEPTPEEKKAAVKKELLDLFNRDDSSTRKPPSELLSALEKDFAIKNIGGTITEAEDFEMPKSIVQKNGTLVEVHEGYTVYTFEHKDIVMCITKEDGKDPELLYCIPTSDYSSSLTGAFGFDLSDLFFDSNAGSPDEDDENGLPELTADDLTVSEDFATCTISEDYLKGLLTSYAKSTGYTDAEQEEMLSEFEGEGVYTVAEKKLVINVSGKSKTEGKVTMYVLYQDHPSDGMNMEMSVADSLSSLDQIMLMEISFAINDLKYDGDKPVFATASMNLVTTLEQSVMGMKMEVVVENALVVVVDVTDENAPRLGIVESMETVTNVNGEPVPDFCSSERTEMGYDPTKTEKRFVYGTYTNDVADAELYADEILFGDAVEAVTLPEDILAFAEANYEDCKSSLEE